MTASKNLIQAAAGVGGNFYPYTIDNSARFDVGSSPYLSRTLGTSGNQKTWTVSYWYKPASVASWYYQFSTGNSSDFTYIAHTASTSTYGFRLLQNVGNLTQVQMQPTRLLRDTSAWYHIVWAIDTTQATTANRVRLYINGVEETSWQVATYPSQNYNFYWGKNSSVHYVGNHLGNYSNGYMAQVALVFGSQLTPSDFAESKNGVWVPKDITGLSYGAEGSLLAFQDSASLGDDTSGNTNDYASSGLTSSDQMLDTPTNNFCTLNPLYEGYGSYTAAPFTLSEGNLQGAGNSTGNNCAGTMAIAGKNYFESTWTVTGNGQAIIGIMNTSGQTVILDGYYNAVYVLGTSVQAMTFNTNDTIGVATDVDGGTVKFYRNGTLGYTASVTLTDDDWFPWVYGALNSTSVVNFGQSSFAYTPPTGYETLSTANFPEPTLGPNSATTSGENFNNVIYTGTGGSQSITGVGFQPDFTWIKRRSAAERHWLTDAVRGVTKGLYSNFTDAEVTRTDQIQSFDSDGFTLGADSAGYTNVSGQTYVGWNWKGNGSGVSNTNGSVTSTVSANTNAGFSIVTYTGSSSGISVGHGLSSAPEMIIWKARGTPNGSARSWIVWTKDLTSTDYILYLNLNNAQTNVTAGSVLSGSPTATTFSLGTEPSVNWNAENYLAYCFHSVEGFSKVGKYTGNGSTDGPFVYTGHSVAYLLTKKIDTAGESWIVFNAATDPSNPRNGHLVANSNNAEGFGAADDYVDFLSNGFKLRDNAPSLNASGGTYIYMAFAENPFKYANAR